MNSLKLKNALKKTLKNNALNSNQLKFFSNFFQKPESPTISNKPLPSKLTPNKQKELNDVQSYKKSPQFMAKLPIPDELLKDPKTGFVKLITGPDGKTHKKLQSALQCDFNILEKDQEKQTKNSCEKLYFQISAKTQKKLDVAVAYLTQLIEQPELRKALRDHAYKLFVKPSLTERKRLVFSVRADKIWVLTGQAGANLKDAMERSGAKIHVDSNHDIPRQMAKVLIKGTANQREQAKKIVLDYCSERMIRANGEVEYEDTMSIPPKFVRRIVGKQREMLKTIEKTSLCRLKLITKPEAPEIQVVKLRGSAEEISAAKAEIEALIKKWSDNRSGKLSEIITIPISCISRLIGKRGENIEAMQQLTGAIIDVQKYEAPPEEGFDATKFKKVSVYGDRDGIERAKTEVQKLIDSEAATSDDQSAATHENGHNADCTAQTSSAEHSASPDSK